MYLLRHGQSQFNVHFNATGVDPGIEDPHLTEFGVRQAQAAAQRLDGTPLTRIIVSPYTRALQTAAPIIARHRLPVQVMHEVRERAAYVCDVGSPREVLQRRFPSTTSRTCRRAGGMPASSRSPRPRARAGVPGAGGCAPGPCDDARGQPLGLHPRAHRHLARQRRAAALRPGQLPAATAGLGSVGAPRLAGGLRGRDARQARFDLGADRVVELAGILARGSMGRR